MQSLTTVADPVWNSFMSERVTVNSRERLSRTSKGQASTPYNNTGRHLLRIRSKTTSSEASRPSLLNTALKAL